MNETFSLRITYFDYYLFNYRDRDKLNDEDKIGKIKFKNLNFCNLENIIGMGDQIFYNNFMLREINEVPIIRIFGTTFRGQKCCLNIHNYFPYFYIEINKDNYFPVENIDYLRDFAFLLEKCYSRYVEEKSIEQNENIEKNSNNYKWKKNKQIKTNNQSIHKIEVIEKFKFYGFTKEKSLFLKISVYEPKSIKILMDILHGSIIRGRHYQCYEAHLSFSMHFFADYNLYGMGLIKFTNFTFRYDIPDKIKIANKTNEMGNDFLYSVSNFIWKNKNTNISKNEPANNNLIITDDEDFENNFDDDNFQIWDNFRLFNQGKKIFFNNLIKSSKSPIELDIDVNFILNKKSEKVQNFSLINFNSCLTPNTNFNFENMFSNQINNLNNSLIFSQSQIFSNNNLNSQNKNNLNELNLNLDSNKDSPLVNIHNLNNHLKYTKTLIELWEDEISRREELNLPELLLEKISNQNYFILVQDLILKFPDLSLNLINNNTKSLQYDYIINLNEEHEFLESSNQEIKFDFYINEERLKLLTGKKNKLHLKKWMNFKRGNFVKYGSNSDFNLLKKFDNKDNENESDDIDDIMSTVSEISLPNCTRNKIRDILTTRSIDEYFSKSEDENSVKSKSVDKIDNEGLQVNAITNEIKIENADKYNSSGKKLENKYSLLKINSSILNKSENKLSNLNNHNILNKTNNFNKENIYNINDNFINLYKNLYSFRKVFPDYIKLLQKLVNSRDYIYNLKINKFLMCLFYSNIRDFNLFNKHKNNNNLQINNNRINLHGLAISHTGLNFFLRNYNKVVQPLNELRCKGVITRREKIDILLKKVQSKNESFYDNLKVLTYMDLLFVNNSKNIYPAPNKYEVIEKMQKLKNNKLNRQIFNNKYFKQKYKNNVLEVEEENFSNDNILIQNENNLLSLISENNFDKTIINYTYNNEISPITDKKQIKNFNLEIPIHFDITKNINSNFKNNFGKNKSKFEEKELLKNIEQISNLTIFSVEVLCEGREDFTWFHETDQILSIFCTVHDENAKFNKNNQNTTLNDPYSYYKFIITTQCNKNISSRYNYNNIIISPEFTGFVKDEVNTSNLIEVLFVNDEYNLIFKFIETFTKYDPDFVVGYETEVLSIAYIVRRGEFLGIPVRTLISRINSTDIFNNLNESFIKENFRKKKNDMLINSNINKVFVNGNKNNSTTDHKEIKYLEQKFGKIIKLRGRVIINLWRLLESDLKFINYKIENVVFNVLKIREAQFTQYDLLEFYKSSDIRKIIFTLNYYMKRANYNLLLLDELDLINRDVQFTKIYGIDFESSLTRGSQYRVEGVLCRVTKPNDYLLLSASRDQLRSQEAPHGIPLVREPPKNIFYSPVIVLDFQSLYPSIMIAYNFCYSTCLGKLLPEDIEKTKNNYKEDYLMFNESFKKFGVYRISKNILELLKKDIPAEDLNDRNKVLEFIKENCFISPNQSLFVKKNIREGILPIILKELILTRIMIKNSMKKYDKKSLIYKILNNRQLGLKLLANVSYGYTSAGFSGRMPCSEVGDSIVLTARETLLNAIKIVENNNKWNAKVIYGDTDSMFVLLEGRSPEQAVVIGKEMAETVTKSNPEPIKLQFEKVYCPMVILSKKHYAGYKYEDIAQINKNEKVLESKGIETVRRDTCEAVCKIMEKSLKIIFETKDLSILKNYLYKTFDKILTGRAIIKDFIFAKEVTLGSYRGKTLPPSAHVAYEKHLKDPNYLPRFKEREPYIVVSNSNGSVKLKDCIVSPDDFFKNKNAFLNTKYYIEKQILPALNRILEPINVDIFDWYNKYPRPLKNQNNLFFNHNNLNKNKFTSLGKNIREINKINNENSKNNFLGVSKYKLVTDEGSKTINDYFNNNITNNKPNNFSKTEGNKLGVNRQFLQYRDKVDSILNESQIIPYKENKSIKDKDRLEQISKIILENLIYKKRQEYEKICRLCSEFDKLNILEEEVACNMYLCKIYYEKLLLSESNIKHN